MNEFIQHLLGEQAPALFFSNLFFALVGVLLHVLIGAVQRDPGSPRTPFCFSWAYLWGDNTKRFLINVIALLIYLRFFEQITSSQLTPFLAIGSGLAIDFIVAQVKNIGKKKEDTNKEDK